MRLLLGILLGMTLCFGFASANSSDRASYTVYEVVYVQPGDTVWGIAGRYTSSREDIRETVMAIRQANQLNRNADVYVGQALKIPGKVK